MEYQLSCSVSPCHDKCYQVRIEKRSLYPEILLAWIFKQEALLRIYKKLALIDRKLSLLGVRLCIVKFSCKFFGERLGKIGLNKELLMGTKGQL